MDYNNNFTFDEEFYGKLFTILKKYKKINIENLSNILNCNINKLIYILKIINKNPCSWYQYGIIFINDNMITYYKNYISLFKTNEISEELNFKNLKII
jgi:hypothetical protein